MPKTNATTNAHGPTPPLQSLRPLRRRHFNRLFVAVYSLAVLSLLYHHVTTLLRGASFFAPLLLLIADAILAFMWFTTQAFRMNPVVRQEFPENLTQYMDRDDFPGMDIFICTADPFKEPPMGVVNTALSVMSYDYPAKKLSVYVSDDGGSELTMFAFMEAAKFGRHWLPFCWENNLMARSPEAYFSSTYLPTAEYTEIKKKYEIMKMKVETAVERQKIPEKYISDEEEHRILSKFSGKDFSRQNHPAVIQVLLDSNKDKDCRGGSMPNLIYVSREKNEAIPHHFKAGALNVLLRVSASMTNFPIILTLDCDMYSNDPLTSQRVLCYLNKSVMPVKPNLGYVQFPQRFHGLNKADIYGCEHKRLFQINPLGMDGFRGPSYVGTGCFFRRLIFFGSPSDNLIPDPTANLKISDPEVSDRAHLVARSDYEEESQWGSKVGFRYGSLVEDFYTGYRLTCEGWQSVFCNPPRPAFLGDVPISLSDALSQMKRWCIGLLEVMFSNFSPLTFGMKSMGILMSQCYAHYACWPIYSIPVTIYAFLPSLALLNGVSIFPQVHEPRFLVYIFLFVGSYAQDCFDFISTDGTFQRWWSDQRIWLIRSLSSHLFGFVEYMNKRLGLASHGFNVTSKVVDDEQSKRYEQGIFEFGVPSPMFVPLSTAAILNFAALLVGLVRVLNNDGSSDGLLLQMGIAGFAVLNAMPFYEAMVLRKDEGRIPKRTVVTSLVVAGFLVGIACALYQRLDSE